MAGPTLLELTLIELGDEHKTLSRTVTVASLEDMTHPEYLILTAYKEMLDEWNAKAQAKS